VEVNFCKFTNETRNGIEDSSRHSGLKFVAACNGTTAGGGYELALACDEILLIDDRSAAVSLPEVPLLGVLPVRAGSRDLPTSAASGATMPTSSARWSKACARSGRRSGGSSTVLLSPSNSHKR
jgi:enoyl-CoA hydratase/carnithine racemase